MKLFNILLRCPLVLSVSYPVFLKCLWTYSWLMKFTKANKNKKSLCHVTYMICMKEWEMGKNVASLTNARRSWGQQSSTPYYLVRISKTAIVVQVAPARCTISEGCISRTGHSKSRIPLESREMMISITWPTSATTKRSPQGLGQRHLSAVLATTTAYLPNRVLSVRTTV